MYCLLGFSEATVLANFIMLWEVYHSCNQRQQWQNGLKNSIKWNSECTIEITM